MRKDSILWSWKHKSQTEVIEGAQSTLFWWEQLLIYVIACIYDIIIQVIDIIYNKIFLNQGVFLIKLNRKHSCCVYMLHCGCMMMHVDLCHVRSSSK